MNFGSKNIGFFDSGVGGISLLKSALKLLENEIFVYFGDSKNAPYGSKTESDIIKSCINICNFLIYENNCKAVVVACNTASSAAIKILRDKYEPRVPIIAIEPAVKPAVEYLKKNKLIGKVLVLATPFTINGDKLKKVLGLYKNIEIECVGLENLACMIEKDMSVIEIHRYLYDKLFEFQNEIDCVVLGCTHYYFVKDILIKILGKQIKVFDGLYATSKELRRRIMEQGLQNYSLLEDKKRVYIYNSLDMEKVVRCYNLLGLEVN